VIGALGPGGSLEVMRYYLRQHSNAKVEGPFTVEALTEGIRAGRVGSDALASSDLNEGIARLQTWRRCDWFPVSAIADLQIAFPPVPAASTKPRRTSELMVLGLALGALTLSYRALHERSWLLTMTATLLVFNAVATTVRYIQERRHQRPAV